MYEIRIGVGGVILLLESGGAVTGEPSYLISSCASVQQRARFLEKEKDCGSTNSQPEQHEKTIINHITHIKHRTNQLTRNKLTVKQALRLLHKVLPRNISTTLRISPLTKKFKGFHRNKKPSHLLLPVTVSFSSFSSLVPSFPPCLPFLPFSQFLLSFLLCFSQLLLCQLLQKSSSCIDFVFSYRVTYIIGKLLLFLS